MSTPLPALHTGPSVQPAARAADSLFDRFPWLYAFCRERLFRDDTEQIITALWSDSVPPPGSQVLELGCGPGVYARQLAGRFAHLRAIGVDQAAQQLRRARSQAAARRLTNCRFEHGDARALAWPAGTFDAVIASRLFMILAEQGQALAEMHRVLRSGGRCFIAEPRVARRAALPLHALWLAARVAGAFRGNDRATYREPDNAAVLTAEEFGNLIASQPWKQVWRWHDRWYQYALCDKGDS